MTPVDRPVLADRAAAVERHLARVAARLPAQPEELRSGSDAADVVVFNLWHAVQLVIDLAVAACVRAGVGSPPTYADAFRLLADAELIDGELADRLVRAAGFRNLVVHAYADLHLSLVHEVATSGPADLRAFLAALRRHAG
jgi:uncharacterized protein YutE (UPF0331/DUF86 family)